MYIKNSNLSNIMTHYVDASSNGFDMEIDNLNSKIETNYEPKTKSHVCTQCFNPLTLYQINFQEAFKICTNLNCVSNQADLFNLNLDSETCILKHELIKSKTQSSNQISSLSVSQLLNDENLINYESINLSKLFEQQLNKQAYKLDSCLNKFNLNNQINLELTHANDTLPIDFESLYNTSYDLANSTNQTITLPVQEENTFQSTSPCLFDDNFFNEINTFLSQDYEMSQNQTETQSQQLEENSFTQLETVNQQDLFKEQLISESNNGTSKIIISKVIKKNNSKIDQDLKVIDKNEDIMKIIDESNKNVLNLIKKTDLVKLGATKQLLPWEIKSKEHNKRPKIELKKQPVKTNILNTTSKISRVNLVQKNNESNNLVSNLKEKGSVLKKALLNDNAFLSNLNLNSSSTNSPIRSNGYKDLVLSVLKKKN